MIGQTADAQTRVKSPDYSYLMPGDSLSYELSLGKGDELTWSLWLAETDWGSGDATLIFCSDRAGEIWRRDFDEGTVDLRDEIKIKEEARYRLTLVTGASRGRPAELSAWANLSSSGSVQFPMPALQRTAEVFSAGDQYAVEYEFILKKVKKFQSLLELDLPRDLVVMWAITAQGDSIPAAATVKRWFGETGKITLRERTKQVGRITLRLEIDIPEDGEATIFTSPGSQTPGWLPFEARRLVIHKHTPWHVVIIPPLALLAESLYVKSTDVPRSMFAAQQLRIAGVDSTTAEYLTGIIAEQDSLAEVKRMSRHHTTQYDKEFLRGRHAFIPPDLHVTQVSSLIGTREVKKSKSDRVLTWFVENPTGREIDGIKVHELRYDEGLVSLPDAPEEVFWDPEAIALLPQSSVHPAAPVDKPATLKLPDITLHRPPQFLRDGIRYIDKSRNIWGLYVENTALDTLYLVYSQRRKIERPVFIAFSRWPVVAKYTAVLLGLFGIVGAFAYYRVQRRDRRQRKAGEELAAELEKARQTQLKLLPTGPLNITGLQILGLHKSMQSVGGDYYDFFPLEDGRVMLCVADVTGHGYKAALIMSNLQATLRAIAGTSKSLTEIIPLLNAEVFSRTCPEDFITVILGIISADRSSIIVCNAGHNPGYIIKPSGRIHEISDGGIMLGAMDEFPFTEHEFKLEEDDLVVFYTDGIPEATIDDNEEMFGYERLKLFLAEHRYHSLQDIARNLLEQVTVSNNRPIEDDMAIVITRVKQ